MKIKFLPWKKLSFIKRDKDVYKILTVGVSFYYLILLKLIFVLYLTTLVCNSVYGVK
jgi:hypothetical protein